MQVLKPGTRSTKWSTEIFCEHCEATLYVDHTDIYKIFIQDEPNPTRIAFTCCECYTETFISPIIKRIPELIVDTIPTRTQFINQKAIEEAELEKLLNEVNAVTQWHKNINRNQRD